MKKTKIILLSIGCIMALSLAAQAQIIPLVNGDFEANTQKTPFFDSVTGGIIPGAVPGWTPTGPGLGGGWNWPDGPGTGNSGVDMGNGPLSLDAPTKHMYLNQQDPSVQQTTPIGPVVGDVYRADFQLGGEWNNYNGTPYTTTVDIYADDLAGDQFIIGTGTFTFGANYMMVPQSLWVLNNDYAGSDGWYLGISFQNSTTGNPPHTEGWSVVDNVTLQVDNVPEPSTIALLTLGGLSALVGIRRRA